MTIATTDLGMAPLVPLAEELDKYSVTPGILGFVVFALIAGAVWLLMKNMHKQFTKIDFEESEEPSEVDGRLPRQSPKGGEAAPKQG
ncbi:hypothetical protein [Streptomyces sp. TP-A0874]|uniref:hypothetical protein n=1 Tax=Streptomyces sp. TP-A0874 TaxID=549819 RepID=UPI0008536C7A|nr:hypothetical protein [Streptomyces sp. TP-A0874]